MLPRISILVLYGAILFAQGTDFYPQVREIALEAEAGWPAGKRFKDYGDPHDKAGDILSHAGYLDDAERAYSKASYFGPASGRIAGYLLRAWVVYGRRDLADKSVAASVSPEFRASHLSNYADILWRMGDSAAAQEKFQASRAAALRIVDPVEKKAALLIADQGLRFVTEPPPSVVSPKPNPQPRAQTLNFPGPPPFPITADGFYDTPLEDNAARSSRYADLMTKLYERVAAGDADGVEKLTEKAQTPFEKALCLASIEHIFILNRQVDLAELYARRIPVTEPVSALAKAEALNSVAAAWLRVLADDKARAAFDEAKQITAKVADLPMGKISVMVSIATEQAKGKMLEESANTFKDAIALAQKLSLRPQYKPGVPRPVDRIRMHYRHEGLWKVERAAIQLRNIPLATEVEALLRLAGDGNSSSVVTAWLEQGNLDEALASARRIADAEGRTWALFAIAEQLLDEAGGPAF